MMCHAGPDDAAANILDAKVGGQQMLVGHWGYRSTVAGLCVFLLTVYRVRGLSMIQLVNMVSC